MLQQAFSFNNAVYNALFPKLIYPLAGFSMTGKFSYRKYSILKNARKVISVSGVR